MESTLKSVQNDWKCLNCALSNCIWLQVVILDVDKDNVDKNAAVTPGYMFTVKDTLLTINTLVMNRMEPD